jgi:uncharacterized membrane protein/heme-degrading monooxygenase HmoA
MSVLLLFLGATVASLAVVRLRRRSFGASWPLALRGGLAAMFLTTGTTHFVGLRDDLIAMVPPALPAPELLVTVTGVLELAGALGLLMTPTAAWAGGGLALLLVAMFPANVHAATSGLALGGAPATPLGPRTAMQLLYLAAAVAVAVSHRRQALRPSTLRDASVPLPRAGGPAASDPVGVVLLSRLELRSARHLPGFLIAALRLRRALRRTAGAVSLDLAAQPFTRTFWTWSVWRDADAMRAYTRSDLHAGVMRRYRPHLRGSAFRTSSASPRDWAEARRLLEGRGSESVTAPPSRDEVRR